MKHILTALGILLIEYSYGQVIDDFSDGDFTDSPSWSGTNDFDASDGTLKLNAAAAGSSYLSTSQGSLGETTWDFVVHFGFNPSSTSLAKVFLTSNTDDLSGDLEGYFVMIGDTKDEISLYKKDGADESYVIDGTDDVIDESSVHVRIKVTRDVSGQWELYHDTTGGTSYTQEGVATQDLSFTSTSYFGVYCKYTSSRIQSIYFDDFNVSTGPADFGVTEITKEDDKSIRIKFNQNVDPTTTTQTDHFFLNYDYGHPETVIRDLDHLDEIVLSFSESFANNNYTLTIVEIENEALNESINNLNLIFPIEIQTPFRDIVINEIMADPTPIVGLPDAEFLELYNTSHFAINIKNFEIDSRVINVEYILNPKSYLILTAEDNVHLFSEEALGLDGLSLSNGGESLELTDNLGNLVDSVSYTNEWYQNSEKDDGGYTLEQINLELPCSYQNNWVASEHIDGGTPGVENSVLDLTPDASGPNLIGFVALDANTFLLTFDEPMNESSLQLGSYTFNLEITINSINPQSPGFTTILLNIIPELINDTNYTITVEGVTDCTGNAIESNSLSFTYDTNPPQLDRIEIKNKHQINLHFSELLDQTTAENEDNFESDHSDFNPNSAELNESKIKLTFEEPFEWETSHTLTIEDIADKQGNQIHSPFTETFFYTQDVDSVYVVGINLLDVLYLTELDIASAVETTNYMVNDGVGHPISAFLDSENNQLVHLAFANNFNDNKNLTLSICNLKNDANEFITTPDLSFIYDTSSPKIDTVFVTSSNTLEIAFNEKVSEHSATSKENYSFEENYPSEVLLQDDQKSIALTFEKEFEREVIYEISVDEVKDLYGNEIKTKIKHDFVYDFFAPKLDSIIVLSPRELILLFNEKIDKTSAENVSNYVIGHDLTPPQRIIQDREYQHLLYLALPDDLPESKNIPLEIYNLIDQRKNILDSPISTTFNYDIFYVGKIETISQNNISIVYNKPPSTSSRNELKNYELNGQSADNISFEGNRIATIKFPNSMKDKSSQTLSLNNINDSDLNAIAINEYSFEFNSHLQKSALIGDRTLAIEFEKALDINQILELSNFSSSPSLGVCVAAVIDSDNSHVIRLTFEQSVEADVPYTISWKNLFNSYENRLPDYHTIVIQDRTPPAVNKSLVLDENTIWIQFSEPLHETSAEFISNYFVTPSIGKPEHAKYSEADSSIILDFSFEFEKDINYQLHLENLKDLVDNSLNKYEIDFKYSLPDPPNFGDLIITEIMADPTPVVGLSEKEYIEIYNTTDYAINLSGINLGDERDTTTIISGEIPSHSFLILTSTNNISEFNQVNVIGVTSFPSLNNAGETLSLFADNDLIFSTSYNKDWYKNSDKNDGGWALEMIDLNNPCGEYSNWTASTNSMGGTPGQSNSVAADNPDNFGPALVSVIPLDPKAVELYFNEKLHPNSIDNGNIELDPSIQIESVTAKVPEFNSIYLKFSQDIEVRKTYDLTISNLSDCLGNPIQKDQSHANFRLAEDAIENDIIINEILFDPRTTGVDFVEIYNKSEKTIDLQNWKVGDRRDQLKVIAMSHLIINPGEYLAITPDAQILHLEYPKGAVDRMITAENFPNFNDSEDSVLLLNEKGVLIDQMWYEDDFHFNLLDNTEGVSLERISFEEESQKPEIWKSAASTVGFATPGIENSQYQELALPSATIAIQPKVFIPNNDGINDYATISYDFGQSGLFTNVLIYSMNGGVIKTLAESALLSTSGFFTWDGTTNQGFLAQVGYYVVVFETYDGNGNHSVSKGTLVLGAQF